MLVQTCAAQLLTAEMGFFSMQFSVGVGLADVMTIFSDNVKYTIILSDMSAETA